MFMKRSATQKFSIEKIYRDLHDFKYKGLLSGWIL